jgi:predicted metal-dependent phosphoesterase TrpH
MATPERVDLHTHSDCSDGTLAPRALVAEAIRRQVQILSLTDHDTVAGCDEARAACTAASGNNLQPPLFIAGIELTCDWRGREIHVVGLDIDTHNPALCAHIAGLRQLRRERLAAMGRRLDATGLPGGSLVDGILGANTSVTRMHLARALVNAGHAADTQQAFDRWLKRGRPGHVPAQWPQLAATVHCIRDAGGLAVLAHPQRYTLSAGGLRELAAAFKECGGAGIEVSIAGMSPGDSNRLSALARRFGLAGSIGSDFHAPGIPWRPVGRFAKLPDGIQPIHDELLRRHP